MASCALVLDALYRRHSAQTAIVLAFAAGVCASLAFLTKQNFIDAGFFAAIMLGIESHRGCRLLISGLLGLVIPLLGTALWASSPAGPGLSKLWVAIFYFRKHSLRVIERKSHGAARAAETHDRAVLRDGHVFF
jgi:4-amino-4-deoxy-L-arabinose transferase-like glycosyltransferase